MDSLERTKLYTLGQDDCTFLAQPVHPVCWIVIYAHGGVVLEFDDKEEALLEASEWNGLCVELKYNISNDRIESGIVISSS
ncbi:hypothetical protein EGJ52_24415 [Pseudomonas luteola]|uniref:hypothetical protein n=1 Tax=Pseudomonas luteola TaxID=47886 RepID=UPI000F771869|nr:hypothetical protein [Pseudomonas luteola]RRW39519.1 hypothetical protein EGJ52_24415 [Pseudomonas luteola]